MNIETMLRDFLISLVPRIQDAGGVPEIHSAFSTLYEGQKWTERCLENTVEIYERAKDLLEQLKNSDCAENVWPTLDDLAFHAAIFGCHYHVFSSVLQEDIPSEDMSYGNRVCENDNGANLRQVLEDTIRCFESLADAFDRREAVAQHRHLNELYIALSQLQCFAGKTKQGT